MAVAEQRLLKLLDQIAKEQKYNDYNVDVKPISTGGANYTTALFTVTITEPDKEDLHLFAKVAILSEGMRKEMPFDLYEVEYFAYNKLEKIYNEMQDRYKIPANDRLVFAKYYGSNTNVTEETIVLEDLTAKGYECHDRFKCFDWPYASKAVGMLAKFHGLSIAFGEENPTEFQGWLNKYQFKLNESDSHGMFFKKIATLALKVVKEENKGRLAKFLELLSVGKMVEFNAPIRRPMLVHGDYRPSNLMHRENKDGSVDVIPVDLQTLRAGCGVSDLMYFIFSGSDAAFRAKYYRKLIDHYYENICETLKYAGLSPDDVYSREDFDYEVEKLQPSGIFMAVFILPMITVSSENAPSMAEGDDISSLAVEHTNDLYAERLNGVIDDAVRWEII
ncbi:uncharacterized protein LOC106136452 [Amyelois transitella]|uniref:uncharacterized protein LOC106136452 n=1 Tax=Amyelois transitella TaxID=680683 RepID=UPI0029903391|nr:uncharacterized protein LOC106136452 [Amyelois transitella]